MPVSNEGGVVLAAVLIFISMILPITLVILNTIEIETMLPTNEGYSKIASHEADKGFDMAMAALMADNQDGFFGDWQVDPTRPVPLTFPTQVLATDTYYVPGVARGRHDIDYLAESWARHPENYTYYMAEHSRENEYNAIFSPDADPDDADLYSVPTRWIMMNIPFGLDDHGERSHADNGFSDILTDIENRGTANFIPPVDAFGADDEDDEQSAPIYVSENWRLSPSYPGYQQPFYTARPASYLRNTDPSAAGSSILYNDDVPDSLVYDAAIDDIDGNNALDDPNDNQYLENPVLQESVIDSEWSNLYFGAGNAGIKNREYKPMPGTITQYPVGSSGEDFIPAWFESIVSDESSRFNLNTILNIIFQGGNIDYNSNDASRSVPIIRYDDYSDYTNLIVDDEDHPNYSNYLLAIDMVTALLMEDGDLQSQSVYDKTRKKAKWILNNMLIIRQKLDANYDADTNGYPDYIDLTYPDPNYDPYNTDTTSILNGRGRMGDAPKSTLGTWQVYKNPKDFLNDPGRLGYADGNLTPIDDSDFKILNNNCSVYTYETEHTADNEASGAYDDAQGYRINLNGVATDDFLTNQVLNSIIGRYRKDSIFRWRDGLVDLNGDGDLNDEYVLQPVKNPATCDPNTNLTANSQPISEITYRERNHFNFQDPANPRYPSMLNIPDLGSLLMVPMSARETQITAGTLGNGVHKFDPNPGAAGLPQFGTLINQTDTIDGYATDIDFTGTMLLTDSLNALNEIYQLDIPNGINMAQVNNTVDGYHPSYSPDGRQFVFVDRDSATSGDPSISVYDIATDTVVQTGLNRNVPLAQLELGPGGDFFEPGSPDFSPLGNVIAFAGGGVLDLAGDPLNERTNIYITRLTGPSTGIPENISNLGLGRFAFYPDFSPNGEELAYTVIDIRALMGGPGRPFKIVIRNLVNNQTSEIPRPGDPGLGMLPMAPDWSPDGNTICFMGLWMGIPSDIYTISRNGSVSSLENITQTPGVWEMFPCWGWGRTLPAMQQDDYTGGQPSTALTFPPGGISPAVGDPWDADLREQMADVLQNASLAFRESLDAGTDQNWRYMDLPVIPQHVADPARLVADVFCFQPPYAPTITGDAINTFHPQAYPGKVNINTASHKVLRSMFLLMFQGAMTVDDTGYYHGPSPIIESRITNRPMPVTLGFDMSGDLVTRRMALAIADKYAHQVCEYRRWIYNNQSMSFDVDQYNATHSSSITRETVPSNLIQPVAGGLAGKNYRANPFAPFDLDNNPFTKDRPLYDPEPPFRNIADLFNVALYDGDLDVDNFLLEGFDNSYGPDSEEEVSVGGTNKHVVPTADDTTIPNGEASFGDTYSGPNALAVWGPIYQTDFPVTFGLRDAEDAENLSQWMLGESASDKSPTGKYYKQQRFRLFSADDFKWISPYITTRSYVYRIESRGIVRVANGTNQLDVTRDKLWVVDFGRDAWMNLETTGWENGDIAEVIDERTLLNGNNFEPYLVKAFEEVPEDGISLTRRQFTPPPLN